MINGKRLERANNEMIRLNIVYYILITTGSQEFRKQDETGIYDKNS